MNQSLQEIIEELEALLEDDNDLDLPPEEEAWFKWIPWHNDIRLHTSAQVVATALVASLLQEISLDVLGSKEPLGSITKKPCKKVSKNTSPLMNGMN